MVISKFDGDNAVISLLPNQSANWAQTRLFIYLIAGTTLAVGVLWTFAGAWAVLPFSGLEAGLVAWLFYRVCRDTYQRQVITLSERKVLVQFGTRFPQRSWELQRGETQLAVQPSRHHLDAPHLQIFDRHHSIELGAFLNKEDKEAAVRVLKQAGLPARAFQTDAGRTL